MSASAIILNFASKILRGNLQSCQMNFDWKFGSCVRCVSDTSHLFFSKLSQILPRFSTFPWKASLLLNKTRHPFLQITMQANDGTPLHSISSGPHSIYVCALQSPASMLMILHLYRNSPINTMLRSIYWSTSRYLLNQKFD